jgi:Tol biopolymer transport system component/imidazolonepropionase-like amidohydrolase
MALAVAWVAALSGRANADPLTFTQGTNFGVAVSPDETQIVFDLQGTLWVMPMKGGEAKPITDAISDARAPSWSPDGENIAFQSFKDGNWHIYTVAPDGTGLTQVTTGSFDEREPAWSPDGKWLAFSSDRDGTYAIWVMAADGSDEPRLVTITQSNEHSPTWSPDSKRIAYVSDREGAAGIYAIALEGVGERAMALLPGTITAPSWSANTRWISFVETTRAGARLKLLDTASGVVTDFSANDEDVFPFRGAWLESALVYTADAVIKQRDVATQAQPKTIPFSANVAINRPAYKRKAYDFTSTKPRPVKGLRGPQVSPDGKRAVVTALGDLWLVDVTRAKSKPQQLTNDAFVDFDPAWSPDGNRIAFASDRSGKTEIWLHDLKSGTERKLTSLDGEVQKLVWSPDGGRIAFYKAGGLSGLAGGSLHTVEVASGELKQIRPTIWAPSAVSWSPDGKYMAISALAPGSSRFREGLSQFLIIDVQGPAKNDRFVTSHPDKSLAMRGDDGPVWSPDGKYFTYVFDGRLWTVPVTPEGDVAGPPTRQNDHLSEAPSWAGEQIFYVATDRFTKLTPGGKPADVHPAFTYKLDIPKEEYVLRVGKLFDGVKDTYAENVDVLIDGNVIAAITPQKSWPASMKIVDASDKAVIPGMMESHTHQSITFGERLGRLWLAMGVTSVREPGTDPYDALERREAWASGKRLGPREFYAGALTDGTRVFYGFANSVTTPEHLELEMVRAKQLDFDMIKTYVRMPDAMQQTIVSKAHAIGIPVSSHEIYPAVGYGVDAVEHLKGTSRRGYSPKQSELGYSYNDVTDMLSRTGMTVTPTIGLSGGLIRNQLKDPTLVQHPVYTAIYTEEERKTTAAFTERARGNLAALDRNVAAMQKAIKRIVDQGGRITAGTDSPFMPYGFSFQVELELYEEAGLTPYQVLLSATAWPAERLGLLPHLGTLEAGKLADLVIVDGDPLARIKDLRNISAVVANGRYHTRDDLLKGPTPCTQTGFVGTEEAGAQEEARFKACLKAANN